MDGVRLFKITPYNTSSEPITWEYRPQFCVLKPVHTRQGRYQCTADSSGNVTKGTQIMVGWNNRAGYFIGYNYNNTTRGNNKTTFDPTHITEFEHREIPENSTFDYYNNIMEQAGVISHGYGEYGGSYIPPLLHIGCLPCNTYVTSVSQQNIANIVCLWSCRITI